MTEWEYMAQSMRTSNPHKLQARLNEFGAEGWELVAVDQTVMFFKRAKEMSHDRQ